MKCQHCNCELSGGLDTFGLPRESFCQSCWYEWGDEIIEREQFNKEITRSFWEEVDRDKTARDHVIAEILHDIGE